MITFSLSNRLTLKLGDYFIMNSRQKTYLIIAFIVCLFFPEVFGIIISLLTGLIALFIVRCS